jgi:hypothetical protein
MRLCRGGVAAIAFWLAALMGSIQSAVAEDTEPGLLWWLFPEPLETQFNTYWHGPSFNILDEFPGLNVINETAGTATPHPDDALPEFHFKLPFLLHAGFDIWRHGVFTHVGTVWSPQGVDREGFALKMLFGGGYYGYRSGALNNRSVLGRQLGFAVMPGWRFVRNGWIVSVFAGLDLQAYRVTPDDPGAGLKGGYTGIRTAAELWFNPTPNTMISADGAYSSIGPNYNARVAFGLDFLRLFYIGPEVQGFMTAGDYRQVRAGLHVTSFKTRMSKEWSLGVGTSRDSDARSGMYVRFGYAFKG